MPTAKEYYLEGNLTKAVEKISEEVKNAPSSVSKRAFLIELLCFVGDWERADKQLNTLLSLDEKSALTVGTWRQLIRAAQARDDVFQRGAMPDVIELPTERIQAALKLLILDKEGNSNECESQLNTMMTFNDKNEFSINNKTVSDWRDLDDVNSNILELLGTNGKYFWVDFEQVESIEFDTPRRPLDLLWRKASIALKSGTTGEVFVPAIYPSQKNDDALKLGRKTDWIEENNIVKGLGLRTWLVGDEAISLMDVESIQLLSEVEATA
ncbi:MAG: type VI secretion system accessory protein TagJ [Cellvibrionaceae bacterium]